MSESERMNEEKASNRQRIGLIGAGVAIVIIVLALALLAPRFGISLMQAKVPKAVADIRNADAAFNKLIADAGVDSIFELFADTKPLIGTTIAETIQRQTEACLQLLCKGKNAYLNLRPDMRSLLVSSYMYLGRDPWGKAYQFYLGPITKCPVSKMPFRSFRGDSYKYDRATYEQEEKVSKGNPVPEANLPAAAGYPAPRDKKVFIFSSGENRQPDQLPWNGNGGDDINNWDKQPGVEK